MNKTVTISLGSVTYAIKAQKLLYGMKIHTKLIKLDSGKSLDGCIYGLTLSSEDYPVVVMELKKAGFTTSLYS